MVVDIELSDRWLRISVTSALPTGLFRFGPNAVQGTVAISAGALSRVTYIHKKNGGDFPLALELGVFGTDLSGTPDFSNVGGIGIGIPVIKVNTSVQPSFNIHAWAEYAPTRALSDKFPFAFLSGKYYFYTQNHKKLKPACATWCFYIALD